MDVGANVRQKAKDIVNLLQDDSRLGHERRTRAQMYERLAHPRSSADSDITDDENVAKRSTAIRRGPDVEDEDLRRAIEESKRTLNRDLTTAEERDLQRAIQLSKEEEERRAKAVADSSLILFDENGRQ